MAYWTDRLGEYQLVLRSADGSGGEIALTEPAPGYRYNLFWSPDSKKLAYIDHTNTLRIVDRDSKKRRTVDQDKWLFHGGLIRFSVSWSADSRWLAYARNTQNFHRAVFLYDAKKDERHQVTEGFYIDYSPVFDPDGKYLYLLTDRKLSPSYSELQPTWIYANTTQIAAVSLRNSVPSPLGPRNDDESDDEEEEEDKDDEEEKEKDEPVEIDFEDFERRLVVLPPKAGNYASLQAAPGKVVYRRRPRTGSGESKSDAVFYDLEEREEETIREDVGFIQLSADGKKLLTRQKGKYAILDLKAKQKFDKPLATDQLESTVDPPAEWRQMFREAWRLYRDYFYDPSMHQVDWDAMRSRYGALLDDAVTRWDVSYVIGELIGEVNASHTYQGGGDAERGPRRSAGLLGVDWSLENRAYQIERIVRGAGWDHEVRSPFDEPGVDVSEGDYVLAVNGQPLAIDTDPWAAFSGLSEKAVELTINDNPSQKDAKKVIVKTLTNSQELRLRHLAWVEVNRQKVEQETDGRVGYVYVPNTGVSGQTELLRQYVAQVNKKGLVIDERFNSGGQLGDRFVELLNRPPLTFLYSRNGPDLQWPTVAHYGPQAMLINGWSGSGGDAFPWMYRLAKRGPIIGTRTWGGLIGPAVRHRLIDGGSVVVPPSRLYGPDGTGERDGFPTDASHRGGRATHQRTGVAHTAEARSRRSKRFSQVKF